MLGGFTRAKAKPFLKWVGGKTQLLPQYSSLFPSQYSDYYEPFFGGGAVFFHLQPQAQAHINDINKNLMGAYVNIRDDVDALVRRLYELEAKYHSLDDEKQKAFFYEMRDKFNRLKPSDLEKSVLLIFLNKTCFNGLYRENSRGGFNVPFGRYKNPQICNEPNLREVSQLLRDTTATSLSFEHAVKSAGQGDFVYFDPPYHPVNGTSNFTSYSEDDFKKNDQIRLKETIDSLTKRGCLVMLSNSDTEFIRELYKDYRQETVHAGRSVNSVASKRGKITELAILNY